MNGVNPKIHLEKNWKLRETGVNPGVNYWMLNMIINFSEFYYKQTQTKEMSAATFIHSQEFQYTQFYIHKKETYALKSFSVMGDCLSKSQHFFLATFSKVPCYLLPSSCGWRTKWTKILKFSNSICNQHIEHLTSNRLFI